MKYLVLLFLLAPSYASEDVFGDLLGQEYRVTAAGIREKRQAQQHAAQIAYKPFSSAPSQLKQLVQSLDVRHPVIPVQSPAQIPNLGYGKAAHPQQQGNQYRPQVQVVNGPKQPNFGSPQAAQGQYVPNYATGQRGHSGPGNRPLPQFIKASHGDSGQAPIQYSKNVPGNIQQLLSFQHQLGNPQTQPVPRQHRALNYNQQSQLIH